MSCLFVAHLNNQLKIIFFIFYFSFKWERRNKVSKAK